MRKLISILNPIYWTTAKEIGEAVNGYTLTGGVFRRETQVEFATGRFWSRSNYYKLKINSVGQLKFFSTGFCKVKS